MAGIVHSFYLKSGVLIIVDIVKSIINERPYR